MCTTIAVRSSLAIVTRPSDQTMNQNGERGGQRRAGGSDAPQEERARHLRRPVESQGRSHYSLLNLLKRIRRFALPVPLPGL